MLSSSKPVLVLNRGYEAVNTLTVKEAISKVFNENAVIILPPNDENKYWQEMTWDDWGKLIPKENEPTISSPRQVFRLPEIIRLARFDKKLNLGIRMSRRAIWQRDDYRCQYCKIRPGSENLSIDHIIPKSQGGKTTWINVVLACIDCNGKKADRTPQQAGMKLMKEPRVPPYDILKGKHIRVDSWQHFLGDCYWNTTLQD